MNDYPAALGQRFKHIRNSNIYEYVRCSTDVRASRFLVRQVHFMASPATGLVTERIGRCVWINREFLNKCK